MSDKSFGDCPSRNIVKNPLLSTAVTGLSIEDLTHNAVLVPVAATQGMITRSEPHIGTNIQTLAHSEHEFTNFPSGDSNTNVFSPQTITSAYPPSLDHPHHTHHDKTPEISTSTVSKASGKTDDFDVNEYFARLQGTRYVSAPINSNPDQNANLAATEDNLEEINLNDDKNIEVQQSLTADIAQNFSQLPTVLPHVASAVFSSFSNMLNYKSREQTPDDRQSYQDVPFQSSVPAGPVYQEQNLAVDTPLVAEDVVKNVAPPPKEPPVSGSTNFRITTKKKYAQIPGLSSGHNFETAQKIELNPLTKNSKGYFIPNISNDNTDAAPIETVTQEMNNPTVSNPPIQQETYNLFNPIDTEVCASDFQLTASNIPKENEPKSFEESLPPPPPSYTSLYGENIASYPANPIAPPPMFSSTQRRDSQTGKAVLPPSVARRIGSNHPVIKPQVMQSINTENIFVPTFDPMTIPSATAQPIGSSFHDDHSESLLVTQQPTSQALNQEIPTFLSPTNVSSIPPPAQFIPQPPPGFGAPPLVPPASVIAPPSKAPPRLPPQKLTSPPTNITAPPKMPQAMVSHPPTMFVPPVDTKLNTGAESLPPLSNIFSSTLPVAAQSIFPPGQTQPSAIGSSPNVGPPLFFTPPPLSNIATPFYNSEKIDQPKSSQPIVSESPKPLMEPPKSTGAVNFRMNKKRPQYYSGPIEGVGSISNSIKPVLQTLDSGTFQGALFTPEQPKAEQNVPFSMPFDISKPAESTPQYNIVNPSMNIPPPTAFNVDQPSATYHHFEITQPVENNQQAFSTAFDLSRPTTESYEQPEEPKESKGFGIIGSLKSKLSNIDINKIQNSVTTFFDPAYKDVKTEESTQIPQQNVPYSSVPYQTQGAETNLEIFVPNVQQNTQAYNYDYKQHQQAIYLNDQYYKYPNFQNQGQPAAGHCSDHHHYPHLKGYTGEQQSYSETAPDANMLQPETRNVHQGDGTEIIINNPSKLDNDTPTIENSQKTSSERNLDENVARFEPEVAQKIQDVTSIKQKSAINFFDMAASNLQEPVGAPKAYLTITRPVFPPVSQERTLISDSFKQTEEKPQETKPDPISLFEPKTVDLFANMTIGEKANKGKPENLFAKTSFDDKEKENYGSQNVDLFANIGANNEKTEEPKLFAASPAENKENIQKVKDDVKTFAIHPNSMFDSKEIIIPKDSLLDSLSKDDVPILGVSSVPLFGLSTILLDKSKEFNQGSDLMTSLSDRNSSMSFFDHPQNTEDCGAKHGEVLNRNASFSFFENVGTPIQKDDECDQDKNQDKSSSKTSASFFENVDANQDINTPKNQDNFVDRDQSETKKNDKETDELSICETCREVTHSEEKGDDQDVTSQLIENITSPLQLSNPVEALLSGTGQQEPDNTEQRIFDEGQFDEISHITEETIETINVQSATELLEDVDEIKSMNYGWANESALKEDYNFDIDPNPIGFYGNNSLFFDKVSTNADEIKHHENLLARQMSAPSAPPAEEEEEDTKSDEAGILDVHSIEQDANKDFPLFEEFVIEPEADDYKEKAENDLDSFTNRVEKFKNMDSSEVTEQPQSLFFDLPPQPISMVSYFDTGNYAVETHYRNTNTMPAPTISIPPGFEEEFKRRVALAKERQEKIRNDMKAVPDTSTQTRTTSVATYCAARMAPNYTTAQAIGSVGFNVEANITNLVDEQSEQEFPSASSSILVRSIENIVDDQNENAKELSTATVTKDDTPELPIPTTLKAEEKTESDRAFEPVLSSNLFETEKAKLPDITTAFKDKESIQPDQKTVFTKQPEKQETKLPDPINFFTDTTQDNPPETFNRLASYFSSPPKTEHAKSFFELSQSQNHYRHASSIEKTNILDLMKDLTSVQNMTLTKDQKHHHVNYFTVEYDTVLPDFNKGDVLNENIDLADDYDKIDLDRVVTNCSYCTRIFSTGFKVRTAVNENVSGSGSATPRMEPHKDAGRGSVTVNFDGLTIVNEETNEDIAVMAENQSATEYTPVKHHWFYRVDVEDKSIWRGFSVVDSRALETSYLSPELTDQTLVPTDGGRYDVNVMGRLRIPVYWSDKPTNVRRCSWFYKGTTDARYVPYTESVAEKLEDEYRHGMTTGEWHRRLVIPNGEVVVMHGPSVMVHFLHSDAFSTPPLFSFGKRVYRNPLKIRVSRDQPEKIDHLILLVHGAGEYKCQKEKIQSSSRPRVVRRGHDESEIEDTEPSSIDHLLLLCHGVGSACDMRFRSVEEVVEDFRSTSLQLIQSHYRNSYDQGIVSRVEVLPISWHETLHSGETGVDRRLSQITLDSIPRLRNFTNDTVLDVLFYTSPVFCQTIMDTVCTELNRIYQLFVTRNPSFKGGVSLGGHSLGSVILYDLLCHQAEAGKNDKMSLAERKHYVGGSAGTGQPTVRYPRLAFAPDALYALGSPIAIFECIRGVESLGASFSLPTCKRFFNIFHPYDPIAYRIEPLIDPRLRDLKPFLIPHHKGRKRMHLELKDTMARVGADLKQKLLESLKSTWNKWKTQPPTDGQLEKVVEEEIEKEQLCDDGKMEDLARERELATPDILGSLNGGRRVDYVLQEAPLEIINEYLFAMSSHVGYWESEDTMLLMLREIYSALGVQPDSTVPQQNMTVQRTRTTRQEDAIVYNSSEFPSTSHGAI